MAGVMSKFADDIANLERNLSVPYVQQALTMDKDGRLGVGLVTPFSTKKEPLTETQEVLMALHCCPRCSGAASVLYASTYKDRVKRGLYVYRELVHCGCLWVRGGRMFIRNDILKDWRGA